MNQRIPVKAITQAPKCSSKTRTLLEKLDQKAKSIKTHGIDMNDLEKLKTRLTFAWGKDPQAQADAKEVAEASAIAVKRWRHQSVRRTYSNVQDRNCHLFLPFVLAVNPTDCSASYFKEALWFLLHEEKYTSYRLRPSHRDKKSLESIATQCCFVDSSGYLAFMNSLFPPEEQEPPRIAFLYSKASINALQSLLGALTLGVDRSEKIGEERDAELDHSDCVTVMIQLNEKDAVCHFHTDRDVALKAINEYALKNITSK